jgi:hypothetical protein
MTGFQAYRYYLGLKLHFTTDKFDIFKNSNVKCTEVQYNKRNDKYFFERLAKKMPSDRDLIRYYIANFAYGNKNLVYKEDEAQDCLHEWIKRKESITKTFSDDLDNLSSNILKNKLKREEVLSFSFGEPPIILTLYLGNHINIETVSILDDYFNFVDDWKSTILRSLWYDDDIRRIEKVKKFIKYDENRIMPVIESFEEDLNEF